jgi:energy-coupling factor transport system ATP-binding protein
LKGPERGIRAADLAYRYPQHGRGLPATSLEVSPGELVLVKGPSGCGKSTLARCLVGLIPHLYRGELSGAVWVNGMRTVDAPLWRLAEGAGMVFQNPAAQMLAASVEEELVFGLENLGLPARDVEERVEEALARFGLAALRGRRPQTLSGGEQQRLALAAVMARRPAVLALDEPLSMLDGAAAHELVQRLRALTEGGVTVVVCEHRVEYLLDGPGVRVVSLNGHGTGSSWERPDFSHVPAFDFHLPPFELPISGLTVCLGGRTILRDLSVTLAGGQVVAVVGRNGVGKTTLLRALAGLQECRAGRVAVDGRAPDFGMVFQNADLQLFNPSVREEILYRVPDPDMRLYRQLLEALGLAEYEDVPPLLLSEGEKRRVALATVLMRRPRHGVLLDEPSLGQDAAHKAMLVRIARGLARAGQLVLLTTHDLNLAARADRLLLLGPRGLVADGPPARVMRDGAAWEAIGLRVPAWVRVPAAEEGGTDGPW